MTESRSAIRHRENINDVWMCKSSKAPRQNASCYESKSSWNSAASIGRERFGWETRGPRHSTSNSGWQVQQKGRWFRATKSWGDTQRQHQVKAQQCKRRGYSGQWSIWQELQGNVKLQRNIAKSGAQKGKQSYQRGEPWQKRAMSVKQLGRKSNWIEKPVSLEAHEKPFQAKTHEEQSKDPAAIIQKVWRGRPQLRRDTRAPPAQPVSRGGRVQLTRLQTSGTNNRESSQTWEDTYRPRTSTFMRNAQHTHISTLG